MTHTTAAPDRREQLLDALRSSTQPRSILSLAEELRVHANTVRFHLEALQRVGQVEQLRGEVTGPGRPPVLFRATRRMNPDGPTNYRLLAGMLASHLAASSEEPSAVAASIGRGWGTHLLEPTAGSKPRRRTVTRGEALSHVTDILDDLGFAPDRPTGLRDPSIRLRHCPFLDLVTGESAGNRPVICSVHLGLMQGALEAMNSPVTVDRLEPFVEPDLCVANLAAAAEH